MTEMLTIDDLRFEVRRSTRRRSLEIMVDRDGELVLSAPETSPTEQLTAFVTRKQMWVYQQLARQATLPPEACPKVFTDGEGFAYLGRHYRLKLVDEEGGTVKLIGGRFILPKTLVAHGREHLVRWYSEHARAWLAAKVQDYSARMEVHPTGLRVQDLGYRWGSCGKGDMLYFHWKTILLPGPIVEYLVVHELAHLHEPHHTPEFWRRVERAMPDYERRKSRLTVLGGSVEGL